MSTTYAGNPSLFANLITKPSNGDTKPAASVNTAIEALADRTAFLEARAAGVAKPGTATQIVVPFTALNVYGLSNEGGAVADRFMFASLGGVGVGWLQVNVTDAGSLTFDLGACLPKKCRITGVGVHLACAAHAGDPVAGGATLPKIFLLEELFTVKIGAQLSAIVEDAPFDLAAYEDAHFLFNDLSATPYDWDVQNDKRLYVVLNGETNDGGAGAEANKLLFKAIVATIAEA